MRTLVLVSLFAFCLPHAAAERAPASKDAMRKAATDVVVGRVARVYSTVETNKSWRVTRYVAEVVVEKTEKGATKKGDLLYVRYWQQRWSGLGTPPPSASGHSGIPTKGESLRIYGVRTGYNGFGQTTDGGLDVYGPNGFERLKPAAPK